MKILTKLTGFALGFWCLGSVALAETAAESVQVDDPYVRAVPPGLTNSAAYMSLINTSDASLCPGIRGNPGCPDRGTA